MTTEKSTSPTPEQAAWDKKSRYYNRNSLIALALWAILFIGAAAWVVTFGFLPILQALASGLDASDPAVRAASKNAGKASAYLWLILLGGMALAVPLRRTIGTAFWILGKRPADDYKPYVTKPIDIDYEQISDELRIARVGDWSFEVKRYSYGRVLKFRKPEYGYEVKDRSGHIKHTLVLSPHIFKGKDEAEAQKTLHDYISRELDAHTDYFKAESGTTLVESA